MERVGTTAIGSRRNPGWTPEMPRQNQGIHWRGIFITTTAYANHEQSAKLDKDLWLKTEKKMTSLQSQSNMSWIEVQFLDTASKALQACRQTLKWTYAFAFYLARNNMTEIFEDNQKDLEMAVENLSAMFEKASQ